MNTALISLNAGDIVGATEHVNEGTRIINEMTRLIEAFIHV